MNQTSMSDSGEPTPAILALDEDFRRGVKQLIKFLTMLCSATAQHSFCRWESETRFLVDRTPYVSQKPPTERFACSDRQKPGFSNGKE